MMIPRHPIKRAVHSGQVALRLTTWISHVLLKLLPPSLEVFLHRNFGARYSARITGSFLMFLLYCQFTICLATHPPDRFLLSLYAGCFFLLTIFHVIITCIRGLRGADEAHSRFAGLSWALNRPFTAESLLVHRFVEPGLCFCLGLLLFKIAPIFSFWIQISSIALFLKGIMEWWAFRSRVFDAIDGHVEARQVNARVQDRSTPFARARQQSYEVSASESREATPR